MDWRSYADHLAVYTLVEATELDARSNESIEAGEGTIERVFTARVDDVVWSAEKAPALPPTFSLTAPGWVVADGQRREFMVAGTPAMGVGDTFLAPLVRMDTVRPPAWWPLYMGMQLRLIEGRVAADSAVEGELAREFVGADVAAVADALSRAEMDADARKYVELRPYERLRAVIAERREG